jgi:hypothetical protein
MHGQIAFHGRELHVVHDPIKLPSSERDEPGFYYFLSEIALRRLLARVLDNIGFSGAVCRAVRIPLSYTFRWSHNIRPRCRLRAVHPTFRVVLESSVVFAIPLRY